MENSVIATSEEQVVFQIVFVFVVVKQGFEPEFGLRLGSQGQSILGQRRFEGMVVILVLKMMKRKCFGLFVQVQKEV